MEIQIIRHFGPSIAKTKIPQKIVDQLNSYIDQIVIDEQKSNKLNMGLDLAGDVTQEFKLEKEFMSNSGWLNFLATVTNEESFDAIPISEFNISTLSKSA